jgi:replication factor C subunit 2/4
VNADNVFKVCDQPHPVVVEEIYGCCLPGKHGEPADIKKSHAELNRLMARGYAAADVMSTFFKVAQNPRLFADEAQQLQVLRVVGECNVRVAEGCGSTLQLAAMLSRITLLCGAPGAQ